MVAGADLPRERRRPRGLRAGRPAGLRLPAAVPQGRRDRHGLLPAPRPQRGRRPQLHPAADVQADRRPPLGAQALHRGARQAGRHLHRGGRGRARRLPSRLQTALEETRSHARRGQVRRQAAAAGASACCPTSTPGVDREHARRALRRPGRPRPRASPSTPSWPSSSRPATTMFAGAARSTGPWPRRSPSARCCSRARRSASPAQDTRRGTFSQRHARARRLRDRRRVRPARPPRPRPGEVLDLRLAALGVRRARLRVRLLGVAEQGRPRACGRRSSATSSTAPRSSSTSTSPPPRTSGARRSGLVLLLPHGYEGQGPEHSSARIERFLTLCAEDNMQVCNAHHRRRSTSTCCAARCSATSRKPLVVFTPKSLLRAKSARSPVDELTVGLVPGGPRRRRASPTRRRCSGSSSAPARSATRPSPARDEPRRAGRDPAARAALPVPQERRSASCCRSTTNATEVVWLQEEPDNMGPRTFVGERLWPLVRRGHQVHRGRPGRLGLARAAAATPSTSRSRTSSSTGPSRACRRRDRRGAAVPVGPVALRRTRRPGRPGRRRR